MAKRLFSFPIALTSAVARVSFPALSRDAELRPRRAAQIATYTAIAAGLPLALVAGAAQPFIAVVLGDEWLPTSDIVLIGSLANDVDRERLRDNGQQLHGRRQGGLPLASAVAETVVRSPSRAARRADGEAGVGLALTVSTVVATRPDARLAPGC